MGVGVAGVILAILAVKHKKFKHENNCKTSESDPVEMNILTVNDDDDNDDPLGTNSLGKKEENPESETLPVMGGKKRKISKEEQRKIV